MKFYSPVIPLKAEAGEARTLVFPRVCTEEVRATLPIRAPKRAEDILLGRLQPKIELYFQL
jgi:hypothetical protein